MKLTFAALGLFLFFRLVAVTSFPIFNDESMYLRWGLLFSRDPALWTLPLQIDGKQPAMSVLLGIVSQLPGDPLVIARVFTVFFSLALFWAVADISKTLFDRCGRFLALGLVSLVPFVLFYNRLALMETPVMAAHLVVLALVIRYLKSGKYRFLFWAALVSALGWWFKTTALLTVVSAISVILSVGKKHQVWEKLLSAAIFYGLFYLFTLPLRIHPLYRIITQRELERALTLPGIMVFPWQMWLGNFTDAVSYLGVYLTLPVFIFGFAGFLKMAFKNSNTASVVLFAAVPFTIEILVSRIFTSRYLVLIAPVFCLGAAYSLTGFSSRFRNLLAGGTLLVTAAVSLILAFWPIGYYRALVFPVKVRSDFGQYIRGWSSGHGVREAIGLVKMEAAGGKAVVFVRSDSGNPEDAVIAYMGQEENIRVYYVNDLNKVVPYMLGRDPETRFFFVSRGAQYAGLEEIIEEIGRFDNPFGGDFVGVYRILVPGREGPVSRIDSRPVRPYNTKAMSG